MRIAITGAGAMGSVYAARLAAAGHDVLAIGRQEHVDAIRERGLRISGPDGDRVVPVRAVHIAPVEEMDLVVIAAKAADAAMAAADSQPLIGAGTLVLTIQNGIGAAEEVAEVVGADRLAVGIASAFGARLEAPGHVRHSAMRSMVFGPYRALAESELARIADAWRSAGFTVTINRAILAMQWEKLICNTAFSALCTLTGLRVGEVMADEDLWPVSLAAAREAWETATTLDVGITVTDPDASVRAFGEQVPDAKPSALQDFEAGRRSEIPVINGAVARYASRLGRPAVVNATLTALVRAQERRAGIIGTTP